MQKITQELIGCPFCGKAPGFNKSGFLEMTIECFHCEFKITRNMRKEIPYGDSESEIMQQLRKDMSHIWNKRHMLDDETNLYYF